MKNLEEKKEIETPILLTKQGGEELLEEGKEKVDKPTKSTKLEKNPKKNEWNQILFIEKAEICEISENSLNAKNLIKLPATPMPHPADIAEETKNVSDNLQPEQIHALRWIKWKEENRLPENIIIGENREVIPILIDRIFQDKMNRRDKEYKGEQGENEGKVEATKRVGLVHSNTTIVLCTKTETITLWKEEADRRAGTGVLKVLVYSTSISPEKLRYYDIILITRNKLQREMIKKLTEINGESEDEKIETIDEKSIRIYLFSTLRLVAFERIVIFDGETLKNENTCSFRASLELHGLSRICILRKNVHKKNLWPIIRICGIGPFSRQAVWEKIQKDSTNEDRLQYLKILMLIVSEHANLPFTGEPTTSTAQVGKNPGNLST